MKKILGKNFLEKFFMILVFGMVLGYGAIAGLNPASVSPEREKEIANGSKILFKYKGCF